MSEKDTKMLPVSEGNMGEKILSILDRVSYPKDKEVDCKSLEKSASSPDSAIDLTEDAKVEAETKGEDLVNDLLDDLLTEITQMRRRRKKKRARFTDSEKWGLMKARHLKAL